MNIAKTIRSQTGPLAQAGMVSLWGSASLIESVQYGTISVGGVSVSGTASITSVDTTRSVLVDLRQSNNWSGGTQPAYTSNRLALTNSTTVTASRNASGGIALTAGFAVIQFVPGVWKSIQSGATSGNGTVTATITTVNTAKSIVMSLGLIGDSGGRDDAFYGYFGLTNATTITITRGVGAGTGQEAAWIVCEGF